MSRFREEFNGMLPSAINKFEALLSAVSNSNPIIISGYDSEKPNTDFVFWGVGCRIQCLDMAVLKTTAEGMAITWISDDGA